MCGVSTPAAGVGRVDEDRPFTSEADRITSEADPVSVATEESATGGAVWFRAKCRGSDSGDLAARDRYFAEELTAMGLKRFPFLCSL